MHIATATYVQHELMLCQTAKYVENFEIAAVLSTIIVRVSVTFFFCAQFESAGSMTFLFD